MPVPINRILSSQVSSLQEASFWSMVNISFIPGQCWEWLGEAGEVKWSARFKIGPKGKQRAQIARIAYALYWGVTPGDLYVCHSCDNPMCVRQEHLFLGTPGDNADDKVSKMRHAYGSKTGTAKLDEDDLVKIRSMIKAKDMPYAKIGAVFGVSKSTITKIGTGVNWRYS